MGLGSGLLVSGFLGVAVDELLGHIRGYIDAVTMVGHMEIGHPPRPARPEVAVVLVDLTREVPVETARPRHLVRY